MKHITLLAYEITSQITLPVSYRDTIDTVLGEYDLQYSDKTRYVLIDEKGIVSSHTGGTSIISRVEDMVSVREKEYQLWEKAAKADTAGSHYLQNGYLLRKAARGSRAQGPYPYLDPCSLTYTLKNLEELLLDDPYDPPAVDIVLAVDDKYLGAVMMELDTLKWEYQLAGNN
jgi:hypothetical protein